MAPNVYANFKRTVEESNIESDVWYAGYMWMDLTFRQAVKIGKVLEHKEFIKKIPNIFGDWYEFPNGVTFRITYNEMRDY